ncbi:MAG: hypothetical protein ACLR5G_09820 [Eubacteriales bacterium]
MLSKLDGSDPWEVTKANPMILVIFVLILLFVLVSMAIFRSPAVA